jgi:hypothetical protein
MGEKQRIRRAGDVDGLRLFALGRIPRCTRCPRYDTLVAAHARGAAHVGSLPPAPAFCSHQVCAPLADRYAGDWASVAQPRGAVCNY